MADIMSLFRRQEPAKQNGNQGPNSGQQQTNANNGNANQMQGGGQGGGNINGPGSMLGNVNNNNQQNNDGNNGSKGTINPLDKFGKLWDTPDTEQEQAPQFSLDPAKVKEVAGGLDFMKGINPELMQKATSGDVNALMQIINGVGQSVYSQSLEHTSSLTGRFVDAREAHTSKSMGNNVRKELTTSALSAIPNFKHPAVQQQLKDTAERLQKLHPDAAPQEIAQMSIEYYQELVSAINPSAADSKEQSKKESGERGEEFWDSFFSADQKQA